jgi:hypothetical protein
MSDVARTDDSDPHSILRARFSRFAMLRATAPQDQQFPGRCPHSYVWRSQKHASLPHYGAEAASRRVATGPPRLHGMRVHASIVPLSICRRR